jgi:hypothetical protein
MRIRAAESKVEAVGIEPATERHVAVTVLALARNPSGPVAAATPIPEARARTARVNSISPVRVFREDREAIQKVVEARRSGASEMSSRFEAIYRALDPTPRPARRSGQRDGFGAGPTPSRPRRAVVAPATS